MASSTDHFQPKNVRNVPYTVLVPVEPETERESGETSSSSSSEVSMMETPSAASLSVASTSTATNILQVTTSIISVMLFSCTLIMVMAFSLGPKAPIVRLNSLSVSNFSVSNNKLAANWVANFTVYNPNMAMELFLERIESIIFYKENDALSISSVQGFHLDFKKFNNMQIRFSTTGYEGDQPIVEYPVLREIEEDKRSGRVRFSMRLSMWTNYKAGYWLGWRRRFLINPYCLGLNVGFVAKNGSLVGGENSYCDVLVMLADS